MTRLLALLFLAASAFAQPEPDVNLVTSDIENFWRAYDAGEPGNRQEAFQRLYFDQASPGLRDFIRLRIQSAAALAATVDAVPKYYASIRANTLRIETKRELIRLYLSRFQGLYRAAKFPPVYFLIGRLSTGGTVGPSGLLIGTEIYSLGGDVDSSEVRERNPAFFKAMGTIEKLPLIVTHELVHTQQQYRGPYDLLGTAMIEGAADYFTNLVSGKTINDQSSDWAEAHRDELFKQFADDAARTPTVRSGWLYNYSSVNEAPADLGYWIGAEICRDYFTRAYDKQAAIDALMTMKDPSAIIRGSSYAWILGPVTPETMAPSDPSASSTP